MKYLGIGLIWFGYAGVVYAASQSVNINPSALGFIAFIGGVCAAISTIATAFN